MSGLFPSGSQSIGASASASASVLPMNIQVDFFRIDWFDLLAVQGPLKSLLQKDKSGDLPGMEGGFPNSFPPYLYCP